MIHINIWHACHGTQVLWTLTFGAHDLVHMVGTIVGHCGSITIDDSVTRDLLNYTLVKKLKVAKLTMSINIKFHWKRITIKSFRI